MSSRNYSWRDMVLKAWGEEWNKPQWVYRQTNGRTFNDSDRSTAGIYGIDVGTISLSASTYSVQEDAGTATITVTRTAGNVCPAATVQYATGAGTATAGTDYTETSGTLSWAEGESGNKTFTIRILTDVLSESSETVNIYLKNPTGAPLVTSSAVLTIVNVEATFAQLMQTRAADFWWRCTETSGTVAADASGNGLNGTYVGSPTLSSTGCTFSGGAGVQISGPISVNPSYNYSQANIACSLMTMVKFTGSGDGVHRRFVFGKMNTASSSPNNGLFIALGASTNKIDGSFVTNNTLFEYDAQSTATNYNDGVYRMVILRRELSTVSAGTGKIVMNINGVDITSVNVADSAGTGSANPSVVGCDSTGQLGARAACTQRDVAGFSYALTAAQCLALYQAAVRDGLLP